MTPHAFQKLIFAFLSLLILTACDDHSVKQEKSAQTEQPEAAPTIGKPANFDYGKVEDNLYTNTYFNCTMKIPKGWIVRDQETTAELQESVKKKFDETNQELKQALDASEINSANLLGISKLDVKTATVSNPNLMIIAENITTNPGVKTGRDYLISGKKLMQQAQLDYEFLGEPKEEFINGKSFYVMNLILHLGTADVHQRYYATISKGFAIAIIEAYTNEKEDTFMQDYIHSLKFN